MHATAWVCDPVTTGHMLYRDERQIQYSGFVYASPREQYVFMQLFRPTSWRNSYKNEAAFCEDHRNNVLLRFKLVFMTFKSQNDWTCGTLTSTRPIVVLPPLKNAIDLALKNFTIYVWHYIDILRPRNCVLELEVPLVVFQLFVKGITAQINSVLVVALCRTYLSCHIMYQACLDLYIPPQPPIGPL